MQISVYSLERRHQQERACAAIGWIALVGLSMAARKKANMKIQINLDISNKIVKEIEEREECSFGEILEWIILESEDGLESHDLDGKMKVAVFVLEKGKFNFHCSSGFTVADHKAGRHRLVV